jgi:hypothetical protein
MDVDVKVLQEIAQDKARVADIDWWLKQVDEVGKNVCPISRQSGINNINCKTLCWKIWPDIAKDRSQSNGCPCNNGKPVHDVFQAISALSKLVPAPPEKVYRVGDVFEVGGYDPHILVTIGQNQVALVNLNGSSLYIKNHEDPYITVLDRFRVTKAEINSIVNGEFKEADYIGHISELTLRNGKIVKE